MYRALRDHWRRSVAVAVAISAVAGFSATSASAVPDAPSPSDPAAAGTFSQPFEEGGAAVPRCQGPEGKKYCKPTAASSVVLHDGRVLYWPGIEGSENDTAFAAQGNTITDGQSRVVDLRGSAPNWATPTPAAGGAKNPAIKPGDRDGTHNPPGIVGVPGRPGDGLVGSTVGGATGGQVQAEPSSPPDKEDGNGDMFCSYQVQLPDGRVMSAGGTDWYDEPKAPDNVPVAGGMGAIELEGIRNSRAFNPATNHWDQLGNMKFGRWYPSMVTGPDGKPTIFSGVTKLAKSTQLSQVRRTETLDPKTNQWTENFAGPASETSLPLFSRLHLMPNGKVFFAGNGQTWGPFGQAADEATWAIQKFWDPKSKTWEDVGPAQFGVRSGALDTLLPMKREDQNPDGSYNKASVLMAGGVLGPSPGNYALANPLSEENTVDKAGNVTRERTGDLNNPRWFTQAVNLPDGKVFAVNGGSRDEVISPGTENPVHQAEIFDPATKKWTPAASEHRDRTYHNSAVLLPDGRVLVGGHRPIPNNYTNHRDLPGGFSNNDPDPSFEIYSPSYLFRGERPHITSAPAGVANSKSLPVDVNNGAQIDSVVLSRMPATTHVVENDQRSMSLNFTQKGNHLEAQAPDATAAPPGYYYLFVNRKTDKGPVPSVARVVHVGFNDPGQAPEPMQDSLTPASKGSATQPRSTMDSFLAPPPLPGGGAPAPGPQPSPVPQPAGPVSPGREEHPAPQQVPSDKPPASGPSSVPLPPTIG